MKNILRSILFVGLLLFVSHVRAADTVTGSTITLGGSVSSFVFSNFSDGTGEAAVKKIDISALANSPTKVRITKVKWAITGMGVEILFDHTTDDRVLSLTGNGFLGENELGGGIKDPASSGGTGDLLMTTTGHTLGDSYTIFIETKDDGS